MILQVRSALEGQVQGKLELMLAVQSPTWSSEGYLGALGEQFEGPTGAQDAPRGAQDAPRAAQDAQFGLQRRPREVQELRNSSPSAIGQQTAPPCKNHEKHCKVLQKSRFGRTAIDGKMSLGGKLRPLLTPSWLVRVQVGAKRGMGRSQESSKSARDRPRAPQERPKSGQRAPKSATRVSRTVGRR